MTNANPARWLRPPGWTPPPPAYWALGWELRIVDWLRWHGLLPAHTGARRG